MPAPEVGLLRLLGAKGDIQAQFFSRFSKDVLSLALPGGPRGLGGLPGSARGSPSWDAAAKSLGQASFNLMRRALGQVVSLSLVLLS